MSGKPSRVADYPLAEKRPDVSRASAGKTLDEITLDAVLAGDVTHGRSAHHARALAGAGRDRARRRPADARRTTSSAARSSSTFRRT